MIFVSKKQSSHIFSNRTNSVVGRFVNGKFETNDPALIKELEKRYDRLETVKDKVVPHTEETEQVEEPKTETETKTEGKNVDIMKMKMPQLIDLAKSMGDDIFKFGMKRDELRDKLIELTK